MPLALVSNLATGCNLFIITYNEKDLYEFDYQGSLSDNVERTEKHYGDEYLAPMLAETKREPDMIKFSYNLICLLIDNFRGYTTQMTLGDNNVLSLGLNGTLERFHPKIKEYLLSENRYDYFAGEMGLFLGLGDGGHTALASSVQEKIAKGTSFNYYDDAASTKAIS